MEGRNFQKFQGVNYNTYDCYQDVAKFLKVLKGLTMREDDVICVGFPRTGNHWAFEVISMVLRQEAVFDDTSFMSSMLEVLGDDVQEKIQNMKSPRYFTSHFRIKYLPKEITDKRVKIIYLLRNPKDAIVSYYRLSSAYIDPRFNYSGTWDEYFNLQLKGEFRYGSWFDHMLDVEKFMEEHPDHPVHVHCYEQMKLNPVNSVKTLCAFLGKSDDVAEKIAEATKIKNMKEPFMSRKIQEEEKEFNLPSQALVKKGDIGGWREYFTPAQSQLFDQVFKEKMAGSKLAALISQYM